MPAEHAERDGAEHIDDLRRVGAFVAQRAVAHPVAKQSARREELREEDQLAERGDGSLRVPLDVEPPAVGVHGQPLGQVRRQDFAHHCGLTQ